ncbi:40S ribosomal protein S22 [Colletotrichum lupini]|uniref:40S ribosomal protein S22 n=1 Tax=Colletotrichum lupini TaxID=145971 RepID=A0A9Q8SR47_9PEZI|nr:40S ribosomal protein S22 [Colletotrichum lupini]UQC82034.1 40S ribosomal protein S22 [Colletotrichum lupini]
MVRTGVLSDASKTISDAKKQSKCQVVLRPPSKGNVNLLQPTQQNVYVSDFDEIEDNRGGKIASRLTHPFVIDISYLV